MITISTKCVNGELRAGDLVISTPDEDYPCLIGRVLKINLLGTPEHDEETSNETDDVHVNFMEFDYPQKRIREIEAIFSELYGERKNFDECAIDDVIMAPDCLIRVTGIDEDLLPGLLESGFNAACYCFTILRRLTEQSESDIPAAKEMQSEIKTHILDVIESGIALSGYKIMDGDRDSIIIRHCESDTDFEIKVDEIIC